MAEPLNPDVFAFDTLRDEYRRQMDIHAHKQRRITEARGELERLEAEAATAADRATSLMTTITKMAPRMPADG